jgi:excisionase family DNA binding protein
MLRRQDSLLGVTPEALPERSKPMTATPVVPLSPHTAALLGLGDQQERLEPLQVTISEAARLLAYDTRTIRRLITRGELTAVGEGRMRRVPVQALRDYQQRHIIQ